MIALDLVVHRPESVDEALSLLRTHGEEAVAYAGGTELIVLLKLGLSDARHLVGVTGIPQLQGIAATADSGVRIGAAATHSDVRRSVVLRRSWPSLIEAAQTIGNLRVQTTGTVGGNLCFADPQSDVTTCLVTLGGRVACLGAGGQVRESCVSEFLVDAYTTTLQSDEELLGWVELPPPASGTIVGYDKVVFEERPETAVGVRLQVDSRGTVAESVVVVGASTPIPVETEGATNLVGMSVAQIGAASIRELAHECAGQAIEHALTRNKGPFMRSVTESLIERVLGKVLLRTEHFRGDRGSRQETP